MTAAEPTAAWGPNAPVSPQTAVLGAGRAGTPPGAQRTAHSDPGLGSLLHQAGARAVLRMAAAAAFLVTVRIETHYLGRHQWGVFVTATAIVTVVSVLQDLGLETAVARHLVEHPDQRAAVVGHVLGTRLVLAGAASGLAVGIAFVGWRGAPGVVPLTAALTPLVVAEAVQSTAASTFQALHRLAFSGVTELVSATATLGAIALAAHLQLGLVALGAWSATGALAGALCAGALARRLVPAAAPRSWRMSLDLLRTAAPLGVALAIGTVYAQLDTIILALLRSPQVVGVYGLAALGAQLAGSLPSFVFAAALPHLAGASKETTTRWVTRLAHIAFVVLLPLIVLGATLAHPLVVLVAGARFGAAGTPLTVLLVGTALTLPTGILATVLVANHDECRLARTGIAVLAVNVAGNLLLVPVLGADGAAVALVLSEAVGLGLTARATPSRMTLIAALRCQPLASVAWLIPLGAWAVLVPTKLAAATTTGEVVDVAGLAGIVAASTIVIRVVTRRRGVPRTQTCPNAASGLRS
jgi:O-antigen/teichoic acid export membrane protein